LRTEENKVRNVTYSFVAILLVACGGDDSTANDLSVAADAAVSLDLSGAAGACDLVKQDCAVGQKCVIVYNTAERAFATGCSSAGTVTEGQACTRSAGALSPDNCMKGLQCAHDGNGLPTVCRTVCSPTSACPSGQVCGSLSTSFDTVGGICDPTCDLLGNACATGSCSAFLFTTDGTVYGGCRAPGALSIGDACTLNTDNCPANSMCYKPTGGSQTTCHPLCDNTHACPSNDGGTVACTPVGDGVSNGGGVCGA
jgi:hypothetical protein